MRLNDILRICLLSLASRYPIHTVDFDDNVIDLPEVEAKGWTAHEMIEFLDTCAPDLLQAPASLLVDESNCEIFLPLHSENQPAIHIHCRGKIPAPSGHRYTKRSKIPSSLAITRIYPSYPTIFGCQTA